MKKVLLITLALTLVASNVWAGKVKALIEATPTTTQANTIITALGNNYDSHSGELKFNSDSALFDMLAILHKEDVDIDDVASVISTLKTQVAAVGAVIKWIKYID